MKMLFVFWFMLYVLAIVTTFGVGVAVNMIFKSWWLSSSLMTLFSVYLVIEAATKMTWPEWILLGVGLTGSFLASTTCRALKKRGYALFA